MSQNRSTKNFDQKITGIKGKMTQFWSLHLLESLYYIFLEIDDAILEFGILNRFIDAFLEQRCRLSGER